MHMKPTNISEEEKTRIFEESLKNQTPYIEKEPVKIQPVDRWIRCKDEMPPISCDVLVCYNAGYIDIGYYTKSSWFIRGNSFNKSCVTHWQPLPEPPKKNKE